MTWQQNNENVFILLIGKESKEGSNDINAMAVSKNITDSNIEEDERASCNDGGNNQDAASSSDEVVVEAKRRRKSPPVQISRQQQNKEDFNESLETHNAVVPKIGKGLSLKSASDLEQAEQPPSSLPASEATSSTSSSSASKDEGNPDNMAGSVQAALAALQAGQISLNQVNEFARNQGKSLTPQYLFL